MPSNMENLIIRVLPSKPGLVQNLSTFRMGNTLNSYVSICLTKSITASQSSSDIFLITETYTRVVLNAVLLLLKEVREHELVLFDNFFCLLAPHKISYNTYTRELLNMCSLSALFSNIKSQRLRCSISCPLGERVLACHLSSANHIPQLRTWNADGQNLLVTVSTTLMTCSSSVQNRLLLLKMVVSLSSFRYFTLQNCSDASLFSKPVPVDFIQYIL